MYYNNGDIKQVFEDKTVYFYSEASTTHIVYTSGLEVIRFSNG